jgi:fatty-acyl-CoA synthase
MSIEVTTVGDLVDRAAAESNADAIVFPDETAPPRCVLVDLDADRAAFDAAADGVHGDEIRLLQERVRVRDVALLMYTSGTTARPKGCLLTHEAIVRHAANVARSRFLLTADDVFWDPLPLFHIGGIVPMLGAISARATFVHAGHFEPGVALRMLQKERCAVAYPAFDLIWMAVLNHPEFGSADLSRLRLIQSITTPERLAQFQAALPHAVGELCFRGYALFEGYYKEPELTAAAIDADGWFHSGDLASVREDGCLIYAGRLKDMLKVGGENVSALEVEDYLNGHPAVNVVQVVAAPDARYTEVPAAYVQLKPGASAGAEELIDYCVGKIASYKVPRYVRFVTEWPMSGTKIQKFVLREQIAEELRR